MDGGGRMRPAGWLVFDLHTDPMTDFTAHHPVVEDQTDRKHFAIHSVVDVRARTCNTRTVVTRAHDGETFGERHRQYFLSAAQMHDALAAAGFADVAVTAEYTHAPVDRSSLRATWKARHIMR